MAGFDNYIKDCLWHKEKWENNFQKAARMASSVEHFDDLTTSLRKMRMVLDNCNGVLQEAEASWDQSSHVRKSSIKSPSEQLLNGNGSLLASNSSSERSSNGSPFQFSSAGDVIGSGCFSTHSLGSDDYYDPMASLTDILQDSNQDGDLSSMGYHLNQRSDGDHVGAFSSSVIPETAVNGFSFAGLNGGTSSNNNGVIGSGSANHAASYWPSFATSFGNSSVTGGGSDLFSAFVAASPKPSFAKVAQQLPASPEAFQPPRKSSDASISSPTAAIKFGPLCITETPVVKSQQRPHLAKIIYVFPLSHRMDENLLEKHFNQFGRVLKVKVFRYPNGASKTAGIIDFEDAASASLALKKKFHTVDGCQIESKPFEPKSHDPAHVSASKVVTRSSHFVNNTEFQVFIGGIPSNATDEDIEKSITVFGKVKRIQVNPNGTFAFVAFATESDAQKIVGVHSINIGGKLVEVKRNQPQPQRPRTDTAESSSSSSAATATSSSLRHLKNPSSVVRS
ncbi:hypothetical protein BV898_04744 [Hypsibius exemplaris]|uniref:RRM domain-containing protein n=1 Tax=Hypsibius exemplaris TaxID=2072580 RepID=A0A1W0X1D6_HYPEX|nr:hypothetical protein BV898_04744 [Hypsibius exemplaris]